VSFASPANSDPPANATSESPKIRLAILPLENLNGDPEQEFFSDGLTEELIRSWPMRMSRLQV